jgi:F-type H+-transporting ATPase subunit gamma
MADDLATVRARIHGVQQLDTVIGAMRGIAATHAQQSRALLPGFRAYAGIIAGAIAQALRLRDADRPVGPSQPAATRQGRIVICAEQGFVGSFSEQVLDAALARPAPAELLLIGSRGIALAETRGVAIAWRTMMATQVSGIAPLCVRIADALYELLPARHLAAVEVVLPVWAPGQGLHIETRSLLPLSEARFRALPMSVAPLTTLPPEELLDSLAAEYVYAELCDAAMQAFVAENEARVAAMVRARNNVRDMLATLQSAERQVRQEAITAELVELAGAIRPPAHG